MTGTNISVMTLQEKLDLLEKINRDLAQALAAIRKRYDSRLNEIIDIAETARLQELRAKIAKIGT